MAIRSIARSRDDIARRWISGDDGRARWLLIVGVIAAMFLGAVGQIVMPARGNAVIVWMATALIPATTAILLILNRRYGLPLLTVVCALLYLDVFLTATQFVIGIAFALVVPVIGIALIQPLHKGRASFIVYAAGAIVATASVALVELGVPANGLDRDQPLITVGAFGLIASIALGLLWRAGQRLHTALDAADRELAARIEAERELMRTATVLATLVKSSPVATIAVDPDGVVSEWNPAAERVFGWTAPEVIGRPLSVGAVSVDDMPALPDAIVRTRNGESIEGERIRARHKEGRDVIVEIHTEARVDDEGHPLGVIVQAIDVTERSALEERLRQAQTMEAVAQLAGGVAHDINNALTAVGGFAELIESGTTDASAREDARTIADAVGRARELTKRLLAFAQRSMLQPEVIELGVFLTSISPIVERLLRPGIELRIDHRAGDARIRVDPGQFEQAIVNLCTNARDAMSNGGVVSVATSRAPKAREPGEAETAPIEPMDWIVISVRDTGVGIPSEMQGQVFEPFFSTKERGAGSGLGLAMVYGFVRQSGGEIELRSSPGEGTTFEIRLPEVRDAVVTRAEPVTAVGRETILLIDDEPAVRELGRRMLSRLGYDVLTARDGVEALDVARRHSSPIHLVFSDVVMPGLSGPEVAVAVREIHPEAAVLFASGYTADAITDRAVLPEGVDLVEKPFTAAELAARVRAVLDARLG
jgi:two-component system cell cycle sensor histidine kinase/response regulator CckA